MHQNSRFPGLTFHLLLILVKTEKREWMGSVERKRKIAWEEEDWRGRGRLHGKRKSGEDEEDCMGRGRVERKRKIGWEEEETDWNICLHLSTSVFICLSSFLIVTICLHLSPFVSICLYLSLTPLVVSTCL